VKCPHEWPYSTFAKWVGRRAYDPAWLCCCDGRAVDIPTFAEIDLDAVEMNGEA
jgi:putative transposase